MTSAQCHCIAEALLNMRRTVAPSRSSMSGPALEQLEVSEQPNEGESPQAEESAPSETSAHADPDEDEEGPEEGS